MQEIGERCGRPLLKDLVIEASRALARLDADRLEELALSCQALNRDLVRSDPAQQDARAGRLEYREGRLEYGGPSASG